MEKNEDQKLQTADKMDKYQFLKRTLQLVLSVSLFSLFLCYSSGCFCCFPHSFSVFFSTSLFSLFTHTLERKYMFLICNGILAVLAKISVSCSSSTSEQTDLGGEYSDSDVSAMKTSVVDEEVHVRSSGSAKNVPFVAKREQEQEEDEEEELAEAFIAEDEGKEEVEEEESGVVVGPEDEEEAPPAAANDELNKKFEEFIRKMKEEIRIEAQRQPIAV
jgi:flagellar motor protein MotB